MIGCNQRAITEDLAVGTTVFVSDGIIDEILFLKLVSLARVVGLLSRKAWITSAKVRIGDDRFHLLLLKHVSAVGLREVVCVRKQSGRSKLLLRNPWLFGCLKAVLDEGL